MALTLHNGLDGYIQSVNSIPLLSAEEERELAERLQRDGDLDAARQLVVIGRDIRRREDRGELVLRGRNFVMLGLGENAKVPKFVVEVS